MQRNLLRKLSVVLVLVVIVAAGAAQRAHADAMAWGWWQDLATYDSSGNLIRETIESNNSNGDYSFLVTNGPGTGPSARLIGMNQQNRGDGSWKETIWDNNYAAGTGTMTTTEADPYGNTTVTGPINYSTSTGP